MSREVVRKALVRFEKLGFWTLKRTRKGTLIHIVNWRKYQLYDDKETPRETPPRPHGDPTETPAIKKKVRIVRM